MAADALRPSNFATYYQTQYPQDLSVLTADPVP
jgi:hypothetical protein